MADSIFRTFATGLETGRRDADERRRRSALDEATRLYGAGEFDAAEHAALSYDPAMAGQFSVLGEARRRRTTQRGVADAMQNAGPDADPNARLTAGATAALEGGDVDYFTQLTQTASQMSAEQRAVAGERAQFIGSAAASLLGVPLEQRADRARAIVSQSAYANDPHILQMIDETPELSDEALNAAAQSSLSAADILAGRERQQRYEVQDRQFQQQLALSRANAYGPALTPPQVGVYGQRYRSGLEERTADLGPQIMNAMPWAMQVAATSGQPPEDASFETTRINDQGMLRAVARLQTGVGVLTEGEVNDTIGNDLYTQMNSAGANFRLSRRLTPEMRQALAQLVQTGVTRAAHRAWDYRDNAVAEYRSVARGQDPVGWELPQLPHPDDFGALNAAERIAGANGAPALRPNDVRIAPSGREYAYMGPGNWLPSAEGNVEGYQRGRAQRIARGGAPEVATTTQTRVANASNYQRALAAFDAGPDTPERRAEFARASGGTSVDQARVIAGAFRARNR